MWLNALSIFPAPHGISQAHRKTAGHLQAMQCHDRQSRYRQATGSAPAPSPDRWQRHRSMIRHNGCRERAIDAIRNARHTHRRQPGFQFQCDQRFKTAAGLVFQFRQQGRRAQCWMARERHLPTGKKMRTLAVCDGSSGVITNVVSERLNSRVMVCICSVDR